MKPIPPQAFQKALLGWYAQGHRPMPWRDTENPYFIWLAEVMLQQTTVAAVIPYFQRFIHRFPTLQSLAAAPLDDVLHHWQGLGYYRRAHLLHQCAQTLVESHNATFPNTEEALLALPGLGPYTAAVLMATAFNQPANVVDGNVERVITRLYRVQQALPKAKPAIKSLAAPLASTAEPRLYANAIMELGSQICTPQNPQCLLCPVSQWCEAQKHGDQPTYPRKEAKKQIPRHSATAWLITDSSGHLFLQKRPSSGLLASLHELPHSGWEPKSPNLQPPVPLLNPPPAGAITHTFSHFHLTLHLLTAQTPSIPAQNRFSPTNLPPTATLMQKALKHALKASK